MRGVALESLLLVIIMEFIENVTFIFLKIYSDALTRRKKNMLPTSLWNRDVNAAINIVNLLKYEIEHGGRIPEFARTQGQRD